MVKEGKLQVSLFLGGEMILTTNSTEEIAKIIKPQGVVISKNFPDNETYVKIEGQVKNQEIKLIHRLWPNPNERLAELYLAVGQLKEMNADKITLILPYMAYARQDKRFIEGEAVSSQTILKILKSLGADEIVTFDCHFLKKEGEFAHQGIRIKNLSLSGELINHYKKYGEIVLVSPDKGGAYLVGKEGKIMTKTRGSYEEDGGKTQRAIKELRADFDVNGKNVVLIDDLVASGGTMIKSAKMLKEKGARKVLCATVHGLFLSNSLNKLKEAGADEVIATDTIINEASAIRFVDRLKKEGIL